MSLPCCCEFVFLCQTKRSLPQTLSELHKANTAHLDVKLDNVMLAQSSYSVWDTLRLIDFAMAARCSSGAFVDQTRFQYKWFWFDYVLLVDCAVRDVLPRGHAFGASSPELMSAAIKAKMGILDDNSKINGCAADMWSAGNVLYEMLTNHRAFNPEIPDGNVTAARDHEHWPDVVRELTDFLVSLIAAQVHTYFVILNFLC